MDILLLIVGLIVGAALGWFIAQSRSAALAERAKLQAADLDIARAKLAELSALSSQLHSPANAPPPPSASPPSPTPTSA